MKIFSLDCSIHWKMNLSWKICIYTTVYLKKNEEIILHIYYSIIICESYEVHIVLPLLMRFTASFFFPNLLISSL